MMNRKKIIWAVDPFELSGAPHHHALQVLKQLSADLGLSVEPVYVLRPQLDFALDVAAPLYEEVASSAEGAMEALKMSCGLPIARHRIINHFGSTLSGAVDDLLLYALEQGAELIVTNTHARRGVKRLFLGSFAETLLLKSPIPVITVNPRAKNAKKLSRVLYPTDFARHSYRAFKQAVILAQKMGAKITLFHAIPYPIPPYSRGNIFFMAQYESLIRSFVREQKRRASEHAEAWIRWASSKGVRVTFALHSKEGYVADTIIQKSRKIHSSIIMMETERGPAACTFLGSTTRQVVRRADCPVWVIHSKYSERVKLGHVKKATRAA